MLEKIKHKILRISRAAGVEVTLLADGKVEYALILLSRNKSVISIEAREPGIDDIDKLKSMIPSGTPVALTVNGRGVLHKKISESSASSDQDMMAQVLPNAKEADFYIQKLHAGKNIFISVIRKDSFSKIIRSFDAAGLPVIYAACGPFVTADLVPFIRQDNGEISFSGFRLTLRNDLISDFAADPEKKETSFEIGEDKIPSGMLAAYAAAFHLFLEGSPNKGLEAEVISETAGEFANKNLFRIAGYAVLGFFVGLMLLNYLVYNYYKTENNELAGKSTSYSAMVKEIEQLEKQVQEKEYFLEKAGWLSSPRTSYFADQIASTIPSSIKLTRLRVNPLNEKASKKERKQLFQADTILVTGTCSNPTVLNPWMRELKNMKWVKSANNINYAHDPKTRTGNFEVEITVSNEF